MGVFGGNAVSRKHCFLVPANKKKKKEDSVLPVRCKCWHDSVNLESGTSSKTKRQCSPIFRNLSKYNLTTT